MTTQTNTAAAQVPPIENRKSKIENSPGPGLFALIKEDYIAHGRDWFKPGFRAMAVYRFGVWRMKIRSKIIRAPFSILYRRWFRKVRDRYGIELPYSAILGRRVIIEHQSCIVIHGSAVIGDDCIIRQGVTLGNRYNDKPFDAPILGKNVNIGAGAKILGKVTIGDHAQIGANAVVLKDVPANAIAVGIPARIILSQTPIPEGSPFSDFGFRVSDLPPAPGTGATE